MGGCGGRGLIPPCAAAAGRSRGRVGRCCISSRRRRDVCLARLRLLFAGVQDAGLVDEGGGCRRRPAGCCIAAGGSTRAYGVKSRC